MRVSKKTRDIVDGARLEAHQVKQKIVEQLKRLDELPGVQKHARVLQKALKPLDEFIEGRQ